MSIILYFLYIDKIVILYIKSLKSVLMHIISITYNLGGFMKNIQENPIQFVFYTFSPLLLGFLSSVIAGSTSSYQTLTQPLGTPPPVLFQIIWPLLYLLMGFSAFLIATSTSSDKKRALKYYWLQLGLNLIWSIFFFRFDLRFISFIIIIILIFVLIEMMHIFKDISQPAARLNILYLLWLFFAAYLNFGFYILNT